MFRTSERENDSTITYHTEKSGFSVVERARPRSRQAQCVLLQVRRHDMIMLDYINVRPLADD